MKEGWEKENIEKSKEVLKDHFDRRKQERMLKETDIDNGPSDFYDNLIWNYTPTEDTPIEKKPIFNNIIKKIIIGLMHLLGLYGLGSITYIIWNCMLYGGDDWELLIGFNKYREGRFEISVITLFLVSYLISMGYLTVSTARRVYIQIKARLKAREINELDYTSKHTVLESIINVHTSVELEDVAEEKDITKLKKRSE